MSDTVKLEIDASSLSEGIREASAEVDQVVRQELLPAANEIESTFAAVANSIESELARAARNGSLSLKSLTQAVGNDLAKLAVNQFVQKPLENILSSAFSSGGRSVEAAGRGVTVNLNLGAVPDARSFQKSEPQIASVLTRSLARANRNI